MTGFLYIYHSPIKLNNTGKNIKPCAAPNKTIPRYILK